MKRVYIRDKYSKLHTVRAVQLKNMAEEEVPVCNKLISQSKHDTVMNLGERKPGQQLLSGVRSLLACIWNDKAFEDKHLYKTKQRRHMSIIIGRNVMPLECEEDTYI
jgi:hypothetical protein